MADEDAEHLFEVPAVHNQEPVETLRADGADETFGDRVRFRRLNRRADDLDPFATEDRIEVMGELAVAIADQEPQRGRAFGCRPGELTGLLTHPGAVWVAQCSQRGARGGC